MAGVGMAPNQIYHNISPKMDGMMVKYLKQPHFWGPLNPSIPILEPEPSYAPSSPPELALAGWTCVLRLPTFGINKAEIVCNQPTSPAHTFIHWAAQCATWISLTQPDTAKSLTNLNNRKPVSGFWRCTEKLGSSNHMWLVVWNMFYFPIYWE